MGIIMKHKKLAILLISLALTCPLPVFAGTGTSMSSAVNIVSADDRSLTP